MIYVVVMSVCQGTDHAFYGFNVGMPGDYHAFYGCNVGIPGDKAMLFMVVMFNMPGDKAMLSMVVMSVYRGIRPCFLWL